MAEKKLRYTRSLSICDFDNLVSADQNTKANKVHKA